MTDLAHTDWHKGERAAAIFAGLRWNDVGIIKRTQVVGERYLCYYLKCEENEELVSELLGLRVAANERKMGYTWQAGGANGEYCDDAAAAWMASWNEQPDLEEILEEMFDSKWLWTTGDHFTADNIRNQNMQMAA